MDLSQHLGTIITLFINIGAIVYTFGSMSTRLGVAEKTLEELRMDFKGFADLKANIAEIRFQQVHNLETLHRLERGLDKIVIAKEIAQ